MKFLSVFLTLLLSCSMTLPTRGDGIDTLSAEELALHLGVRSWVFKVRLQGNAYLFRVHRITNGKVEDQPLLGCAAYPTDRDLTRIAVLVSPNPKGTKLSVQPEIGVGERTSFDAPETVSLNIIFPLPRILTAGDYILGGDVPDEKVSARLKNESREYEIQTKLAGILPDVKDGLLLRITKKE